MRRILLCIWSFTLAVPVAQAQEEPPTQARTIPIQFQFAPPGARALAMGATFIAIADDATAAESNPAGLTILTKPEISAHLRLTRFEDEYPNPLLDTVQLQTFSQRVFSPAYFSFVYPFKNAAVSVYYQQATHFENSLSFADVDPDGAYTTTQTTTADLLFDNVGLSVAFKATPKLSIGASVRSSRLQLDRTGDVLAYRDFLGDRIDASGIIDDSGREVTFNAGVLVNPNGKVSAGGFYSYGGRYDLGRVVQATASGPLVDILFPGEFPIGPETVNLRYEVPSRFGGGVAFRPTDRWVLSAEVVRLDYSVLSPSREDVADEPESLTAIKDGTEVHFGTEYTFLSGRTPFSVRAGVFTDPDHDGLRRVDTDQVHFTFGSGFVIGGRFQVDFGANLAKRVKEGLMSFVYRF
jgi:long-subunit fatty acid transport protein